jgi:quercetin dioxygenase-like cupin family protein
MKKSLTAIARRHLALAQDASGGRSSETVYGGHEHMLRQTVIAMTAGQVLNEHANPGEAIVHVLTGRVRLAAAELSWEGSAEDLLSVPHEPHTLEPVADSKVLLTVAKR